ncbi:hypothetical protein [Halomonas organivorans]|nr:hypothetical protein [Halomonas organivorans]
MAPAGDPVFAALYDDRMRWPIRRARLQAAVREGFQAAVDVLMERRLLNWWMAGYPGAGIIEKQGLPGRAVAQWFGDSLTLYVDPRELIRGTDWRGYPHRLRPSSSAFLWDGEWDLRRSDLRFGSRYRFISEIDECRDDLTRTERYTRYMAHLKSGRPWRSHQQGVLLDSEARIQLYLQAYLGFLDHMASNGFDGARGKDRLGVAVTREGRLLKINRGLHRLAMAQRLGLPLVPVRVKAVHREWWCRVVGSAEGQDALERVRLALSACVPEEAPGSLDPAVFADDVIWPEPRAGLPIASRGSTP